MPPLSLGSSCRRVRPLLAAAASLLVVATSVLLAAAPAASAQASGSGAYLSLSSQTAWVTGPSGLKLTLRVASPLPNARLGLNVVLYSRLGSRDAFEETLGGVEPASEYPLDSPATIPLAGLRRNGRVRLHLPVTTASVPPGSSPRSPTLTLDCPTGTCPGVYPLELVLLDRTRNVALASLTTYLVYAPPESGSLPLEVSLVLPLGAAPALAPGGAPLPGTGRLAGLERLLEVIGQNPETPLSLALHAQALDALVRSHDGQSKAVLSELAGIVGNEQPGRRYRHELLQVPFASAQVDELAAAGLGDQLAPQLSAERTTLAAILHSSPPTSPYVASGGLDPTGLSLLRASGVRAVVVPSTSLAAKEAPVSTRTAPLLLTTSSGTASTKRPPAGKIPRGTTEAFLSDPGLAAAFDGASRHPVLAAHQLLAELASVYFDDPFSPEPRGVVMTPSSSSPPSRFLSTLLGGLAASPILQATTLTGMLDSVPVGANGMPATGSLDASRPGPGPLSAASVRAASLALDTVRSVVPGATGLSVRLGQSILLGESAHLSKATRRAYEAAPGKELRSIGRALSLSGSRTATLTSRSGRIPITVQSSLSEPVHVLLRLRSSDLTFSANRSVLEIPLDLTGKASQSDVRVSARTSGSSRLDIALLSPRNGFVLLDESIAVHSTAISGVALVLSAGALLVLLVWWIRSSLRRRRQGAAEGSRDDAEPAGDAGAGHSPELLR